MLGDNNKPINSPAFPLYLLPSLSIPFRRRKTTPATEPAVLASSGSPTRHDPPLLDYGSLSSTPDSGVPSLSSSPESVLSDRSDITTPTSPLSPVSGYFWNAEGKQSLDMGQATARLARKQPDTLRCSICATDIAFAAQIVSKGFTGRHGRAILVSPPSAVPTPNSPASPVPAHASDDPEIESAAVNLINVRVGRPESRQLVTGAHVVADISCVVCGSKLGWKYVDAREWTQKYKVGKFILETARVVAHRAWEDENSVLPAANGQIRRAVGELGRRMTQQDAVAADYRDSKPSHKWSMEEVAQPKDDPANQDDEVVFDSGDEEECEDLFAGTWDARTVAKRRSRHRVTIRG